MVAHLAIHDKVIGTTAGDLRVGGIAEVCVAAAQRGQGLVRRLMGLRGFGVVGIPALRRLMYARCRSALVNGIVKFWPVSDGSQ